MSVDENDIDVSHVTMSRSQKQACVENVEVVRHDHTYFVSASCRLTNKVNDLINGTKS